MDDEDIRTVLHRIYVLEDFARHDVFRREPVLRSRSLVALTSLSEVALAVHGRGRRIVARKYLSRSKSELAALVLHLQ